jgi:hypothetical protein
MNGGHGTQGPSWPAAVVAVAFLALVGAIFLSAYYRDGVDAALKVWAAIGTLVGVVTGAIPSYFFRAAAQAAQRNVSALVAAADHDTIQRAQQYGFRA